MTDGTFTEIKRDKGSDKVEAKVMVESGTGLVKGDIVTVTVAPLSLTIRSIREKDDGAELELQGTAPGDVHVDQ